MARTALKPNRPAARPTFETLGMLPGDLLGRTVRWSDDIHGVWGDGVIVHASHHEVPGHDGTQVTWTPSGTHAEIGIDFHSGSLDGKTSVATVSLNPDGTIRHQFVREVDVTPAVDQANVDQILARLHAAGA